MARDKTNTQVRNEGETVVGLFQDQPSAEAAIQRLTAAGFLEQQIGVAVRDREKQQAITEGTGTQAAEGATGGALGGGVVGGVIGLLAGVGALAIPGIGPVIAGGALASTLAGAGIGAAAGGLLGALVGMGIPEEDAKHFEEGFRQGRHPGDRAARARGSQRPGRRSPRTAPWTSARPTGTTPARRRPEAMSASACTKAGSAARDWSWRTRARTEGWPRRGNRHEQGQAAWHAAWPFVCPAWMTRIDYLGPAARIIPATPGRLPGPRSSVKARSAFVFDRQRIVVAGQDSEAVAFAIATLRRDGHCVSHIAESHPVVVGPRAPRMPPAHHGQQHPRHRLDRSPRRAAGPPAQARPPVHHRRLVDAVRLGLHNRDRWRRCASHSRPKSSGRQYGRSCRSSSWDRSWRGERSPSPHSEPEDFPPHRIPPGRRPPVVAPHRLPPLHPQLARSGG